MKVRILLFLLLILLSVVSCGGIAENSSTSSVNQFYTSNEITFTGEPSADFSSKYKFYAKRVANSQIYEFNDIYVAYSSKYIYIGHKAGNDVTGAAPSGSPDFLGRGAFYVYIDNNITSGYASKGMKMITDSNNGVNGRFNFLDDNRTSISENNTNDKFSVYIKHFRPYKYNEPTGESLIIYKFWDGILTNNRIIGSSSTISISKYLTNAVTEMAIPFTEIFGTNTNNLPKSIKIEFMLDDGAYYTYYTNKDMVTNNPYVTNTNGGCIISNWLILDIN